MRRILDAERIDVAAGRALLVLGEELLHTGEAQRRLRHPEIVVDDAIHH
jgi:hypothetical protein